ncbi:hypothetical protein N7524_011218 [Penicillium chrysogenum]|nr:hypothetical protein N7524_011218 [Penicillium chrysogenum]
MSQLIPQQHESARNLVIMLVRHYGSEKTVGKGYRPAALIQATPEHVPSPDTFMTFFLSYIYEDLRSDEGHVVDSDITHALAFFEGFFSWEPEQINKLHEGLEKFAEYIVGNFLLPLSRKFDRAAARKRFEENAESCADDDGNLLKDKSSDEFQYLEVAYILPYYLATVAPSETDLSDSKKKALRILDIFDPRIIYLVNRPEIDSPINALTLTLDYHRLFGEFKIYFEPTKSSPFLRDPLFPITRSLTLSPYRTVDPLSSRLLGVHRAIALIMKLSGAGEYIERVLRDIEELDIREDGSTHLGYLAGLRLGGWLDTLSVH